MVDNTYYSCIYASVLLFVACGVGMRPINYGKDICSYCSMLIVDQKFGAEIVTQKGKVLKFDSGECMMRDKNVWDTTSLASVWIIDYNHPTNLIDATTCFYVQGGDVVSPMGGALAAFSNKDDAMQFQQTHNANLCTWQSVKDIFITNEKK